MEDPQSWINRESRRELRKKKRIYDLYKKGCATQKDYNDVVRLYREKVI